MADGWNELVATADVIETKMKSKRTSPVPTHIVIHITGTNDFAAVKKTFLTSVSANYVIKKDGTIAQFVRDRDAAWHAGIESAVARLYRKGDGSWTKYLRQFSWYKGYPSDARYLLSDLKPTANRSEATFVMRSDQSEWPEYAYFRSRWPGLSVPVHFDVSERPNDYAIGIEILSVGAKKPDAQAYTPAMYSSLQRLVENLSQKYGIARRRPFVVGHEDVNPVARFGWDPHQGFDWSTVLVGG